MSNHITTKRVLITGGLGFIGSHLAERLIASGHDVTLVDDLSTGNVDNIASLTGNPRLHTVKGDIADEMLIDQLVAESDVVYHLAAAVGVKLIVEDPLQTIVTNIAGTHAVLEAAARYRTRVLIASTSEVYGKSPRMPFSEDDDVVLGPTSKNRWSYAASKMVDEFLALAYYDKHGLETTIFRLFNTVGPRQSGQYGMVVPRFVRAALRGEPLCVHGNGSQTRCFLHVHDAVAAIQQLAESSAAVGRVFNIGATESVSILELAQQVLQRVGVTSVEDVASRVQFVPYEEAYGPGFEDMQARRPDTTRIFNLCGWGPQRDLAAILDDVFDFERMHLERAGR